jgi:hypothetical protein
MGQLHSNWCNLLAGVMTPDLADKLARAARLAESQGEHALAADLRDWHQRVAQALNLEHEAEHSDRPEMWLG